ncbi:MAG: hypothetical protein U1E24_12890, partial [Phenylobacterium sp.]|nr:hypothetical protein [Phenylobacterium sp.]
IAASMSARALVGTGQMSSASVMARYLVRKPRDFEAARKSTPEMTTTAPVARGGRRAFGECC